MRLTKLLDRVISFFFYALFFVTPFLLTSKTSELFEFNKMWFVFAITIIVVAAWIGKMILSGQFSIRRTPLDIPIILFLASQIVSTIFSWDVHVSLWGYYSRFNGGLLSIISYILLYYAFVSNFTKNANQKAHEKRERQESKFSEFREKIRNFGETHGSAEMVKRMLLVSLLSGLIVTLWGIPGHFGYDPTCFVFRGNLDVSCWTQDFQPKLRIFSTLGQPNWLAAYLAILIPIALAFAINSKLQKTNLKQSPNHKKQILSFLNKIGGLKIGYWNLFGIWNLIVGILFLLALLYTKSQSGFLALVLSLAFFTGAVLFFEKKEKLNIKKLPAPLTILIGFGVASLALGFIVGSPVEKLNKFTLPELRKSQEEKKIPIVQSGLPSLENNITSSGDIRKVVWRGALTTWQNHPLIGTGVETFAYSYYKYKPAQHNVTSEWNFLYNKAHNEFLNYLATTGAFGLGSYLLMIATFLFIAIKSLNSKHETRPASTQRGENSKQSQISKSQNEPFAISYLPLALIASYISILITNFFGFSVVLTNLYLFMIPAFTFIIIGQLGNKAITFPRKNQEKNNLNFYKLAGLALVVVTSSYLLIMLFRFWEADRAYALGYSLDRAGVYQEAYFPLVASVQQRASEPTFKDELAINNAILGTTLAAGGDPKNATEEAQFASQLIQNAVSLSGQTINEHPNNVVFLKTRVRLFYNLAQIDPRYLSDALDAIKKAEALAPNDATILYNLGVIYGQTGDTKKAVEVLEKTVKVKPDYRDAYYALALFYHDLAVDDNNEVKDQKLQEMAEKTLKLILENIATDDAQTKALLDSWK